MEKGGREGVEGGRDQRGKIGESIGNIGKEINRKGETSERGSRTERDETLCFSYLHTFLFNFFISAINLKIRAFNC